MWGATSAFIVSKLDKIVSIHAPVWGATDYFYQYIIVASFNPRTRVGCDTVGKSKGSNLKSFNPRTRVGCDLKNLGFGGVFYRFNPRTRVGCDPPKPDDEGSCGVSIHAPVWGATTRRKRQTRKTRVSIHAPVWGATRMVI